ncbi:hypothetical protein PV755_15705 [Streptomyces caniscabiei]|uniref:Uncharacterized protein n=1 Tax=Streptomyces caniscabiei TaxID=2746961 RepID=A0A927L568_9ACTN|nr:hypothetical protein [Streptomyces caniscabiei]MBD9725061.1 hypothetical protein [Streptomyces caniscabiei]MDX3510367.1 hypothetical protein [Streptomyces caniscabiei]
MVARAAPTPGARIHWPPAPTRWIWFGLTTAPVKSAAVRMPAPDSARTTLAPMAVSDLAS